MAKAEAGFGDILTQLRITNRLLAARIKGTMSQQEIIGLLSSTGASNQEIADVLNTTSATVATTLQRLKKKSRKPADTGPTETTDDGV